MPHANRRTPRLGTLAAAGLALVLALGWACREVAFAREKAALLASGTFSVNQLEMKDFADKGKKVGSNGVYLAGDTPGSTKFVTGRFVIDPGKTPHAPHTHVEEEVMIIESGNGEIFCDGKTTKVGPGSVMYTTPEAPHGINNTGDTPLVFYYVKWAGKDGASR
ncbi:MAG: cupin domain-containing protein [Isosphaeraceae bacterium]|nr:cupin domain-containing protein [Isosphaeraceae bacterium]